MLFVVCFRSAFFAIITLSFGLIVYITVINEKILSTYFKKSMPHVLPPPFAVGIRIHYYNKPDWIVGDIFKTCDHKCYLTWGADTYASSNAVIFHAPEIKFSTIPPKKMKSQIWILHAKESPSNYNTSFTKWNWLFNWTMTYLRDADILAINGAFEEISNKSRHFDPEPPNPELSFWKFKMNKAAWFVTNCKTPSIREDFVELLSKKVVTDIYGDCGEFVCGKETDNSCMDILRDKYKIYLSFENSLCRDYITEKSFKLYQSVFYTIPVTRGIGKQYSLYLPPKSYINTCNFNNKT